MTEPDVTLTDYALAAECGVLCLLMSRWRFSDVTQRVWWIVMFASVGLASMFGGTVHGFVSDPASTGYLLLWTATLLALGVTSVSMWIAGANAALRDPARRYVAAAAGLMFVVYACVVLFVSSRFVVTIVAYLPAAVFLLAVFSVIGQRRRRHSGFGMAGLGLTFVAAVIQQARIGIHPVYFNHNALYHLVQGVGLALLFLGARQLLERGAESREGLGAG